MGTMYEKSVDLKAHQLNRCPASNQYNGKLTVVDSYKPLVLLNQTLYIYIYINHQYSL